MKRLALTLSFLVAAALQADAQCPDGTPPPCGARRAEPARAIAAPPPAAVRARRIVLLPFRNVTRAPAQEWLVAGGPIMLAASLGQFNDLSIVPEERLIASLRRASLPTDVAPDATQLRRIASETGGWTAISGTIIGTGGRIRIGVQALDIATTQVLTRVESEIAADADVRFAFDTLAARLLVITGIATTTGTGDLAGLTTRSVDAFRDYVTGVDALRRAEGRVAIDAFNRAVRRDSTFALAWARLGLATIIWDTESLLDLRSPAYAAIERANRLADRLPARELRIISALRSAATGQIAAAKTTLDSMIAADSSDVEAREYRALAEMHDRVIVDTLAATPQLRGSWNDAARRLQDVIQRDPGRGSAYALLISMYLHAAGATTGQPGIPALRRDPASLAALLAPNLSVPVIPVLRDSIEFLSGAAWLTLAPGEARRLQRRAAEATARWTDRWLATSPSNGFAQYTSAMMAERLGEFERALVEAARVDTATVTVRPSSILSVRVRALMGLGRLDEAVRLADSVRRTGLASRPIDDGLARLAIAQHLIAKRWDAAAAVADTALRRSNLRAPACAFLPMLANDWIWPLPARMRAQVMDTVAAHIVTASSAPSIATCSLDLAVRLARDSVSLTRGFALARVLAQFDSVAAIPGARADAAMSRLGALARALDTASVTRLGANERYVRIANDWSMLRRFEPAGALVSGDSVSVSFRWISPDAAVWDVPESLVMWTVRAQIRIGQGADTVPVVIYADHLYVPRDAPVRGGVAEAAAALTSRGAAVRYAVDGIQRAAWPAEVRLEGDVIRLVVKGELAAAIRRSRPATAQFGLLSCGVVTGGLCSQPSVPIEYR